MDRVQQLSRRWKMQREVTRWICWGDTNRLTYSFLMKHKFGAKLIEMILDKEKMDKTVCMYASVDSDRGRKLNTRIRRMVTAT